MIIGVRGQQRTGKDAITTMLAKEYIDAGMVDKGFGNTTLLVKKKGFTYTKMDSSLELLDKMTQQISIGKTRQLYIISEAHRVLNPRLFSARKAQETMDLAGIFQDDKLESFIIYNCHIGNIETQLLGVDNMLRGATNLYIDILTSKEYVRATGWCVCRFKWTDSGLSYNKSIYIADSFNQFISKELVR